MSSLRLWLRNKWIQLCLSAILLFSLATGLYSANYDSLTTDEGIHVASAYLAIQRGEFRFDPEHPYLFKYLTALPLFALKLNNPPEDQILWAKGAPTLYDSWYEARSWTDQWFFKSNNPADTMVFLMRIPAVIALLGLIFSVYWITKKWFSPQVGLIAAFLVGFNPTIIAHGHLANTDIPITLATLWVIYASWKYLAHSKWQNAAYLGLLFGIALNTKHSAVSLLPFLFIIWLIAGSRRKNWLQSIYDLLIVLGISWALIWLFYGFHSQFQTTTEPLQWQVQKAIDILRESNIDLYSLARLISHIIPVDYFKGLIQIFTGVTVGRPTFILDSLHSAGVWYYFPLLYLFKSPIHELVLLGVGLGLAINKKFAHLKDNRYLTLALFCGLYMVISMTNKLNLGIRHLLPIIPLLIIGMALAAVKFYQQIKQVINLKTKVVAILFVLVVITPFVWRYPDLLGFTNIFVRPYKLSYLYFNDSNLDWGQQVKEIQKTVKQHYPNDKIYANYIWNPYILQYYSIDAQSFDPNKELPKNGVIMVTATQMANPDYNQFRHLAPDRTLANHTLFYRVK